MANKLTVIIPVYNAGKYIRRCLESVMEQDVEKMGIVIVNDGSTDKTLEIILQYCREKRNIRIITTENKGAAHARNVGLTFAKSKYVTFVDADDYLEKNAYHIMLEELERNNADIVECSCRKIKENGTLISSLVLKGQLLCGADLCLEHFVKQENTRNYVCNKIYKTELFKGVIFPGLKYSEDYYVNVVIHKKAGCKVVLPDILYNYVIHKGSVCGRMPGPDRADGAKAGALAVRLLEKCSSRIYSCFYVCRYCIENAARIEKQNEKYFRRFIKMTKREYLYALVRICPFALKYQEDRREYLKFILFAFFPGTVSRFE